MTGYLKELREKVGHRPIIVGGAGAIIYKDHQILLQKREDNGMWGLHGGSLEIGETFEEGMLRELKEEINVVPLKYKLYGIYSGKKMHHVYPNGDEVYLLTAIYFCTDYEGLAKKDNDEVKELCWFDIDNLPVNLMLVDAYPLEDLKSFLSENSDFI